MCLCFRYNVFPECDITFRAQYYRRRVARRVLLYLSCKEHRRRGPENERSVLLSVCGRFSRLGRHHELYRRRCRHFSWCLSRAFHQTKICAALVRCRFTRSAPVNLRVSRRVLRHTVHNELSFSKSRLHRALREFSERIHAPPKGCVVNDSVLAISWPFLYRADFAGHDCRALQLDPRSSASSRRSSNCRHFRVFCFL